MRDRAEITEKLGKAINMAARCTALGCGCHEGKRALWVVFDLAWVLEWPREHTIKELAGAIDYWQGEIAEARAEGREIAEP